MSATHLLHIDAMTRAGKDQRRLHGLGEAARLSADLFLLLLGEVDKVVILGADQKGDGGLVEAASLPVPLLDAVEGGFPRQIEHEKDGDGVVADERQHVDELALAAQVPDAEGDFGIADGDGLFHEVDACAKS